MSIFQVFTDRNWRNNARPTSGKVRVFHNNPCKLEHQYKDSRYYLGLGVTMYTCYQNECHSKKIALVQDDLLITIFRIEFYRIYRIYRNCRKLFLVLLKMKIRSTKFYKFYRFYRIPFEKPKYFTGICDSVRNRPHCYSVTAHPCWILCHCVC